MGGIVGLFTLLLQWFEALLKQRGPEVGNGVYLVWLKGSTDSLFEYHCPTIFQDTYRLHESQRKGGGNSALFFYWTRNISQYHKQKWPIPWLRMEWEV